jgi:phenylacetate-CoA ligase
MTLKIEPADGASPDAQAIGEALTAHTKLKGLVEIAASLPNDGKVIDDLRDYSK